ncbi:hypothetical protein H920_08612 [Fukomys damarensis]|uniref:Uncharacterized protein n=1 Tax=Fukomys damarensis TaxID=885580 RepID=A0A091DCY7_FUKDA|nr:hypothetical protein H920_08612 [Fukomys damarensis]
MPMDIAAMSSTERPSCPGVTLCVSGSTHRVARALICPILVKMLSLEWPRNVIAFRDGWAVEKEQTFQSSHTQAETQLGERETSHSCCLGPAEATLAAVSPPLKHPGTRGAQGAQGVERPSGKLCMTKPFTEEAGGVHVTSEASSFAPQGLVFPSEPLKKLLGIRLPPSSAMSTTTATSSS